MFSRAHQTASTTTTTYRTLAPRSAASIKTPQGFLANIAEHKPEPMREPSPPPPRPSIRSVSVTSFLSDGTVEIEGFGFDEISEYGDDDNSSVFGGESLYEESVCDGQEGGEPDLSRRAEKILANAKRKLDLCGRNISRARSSLILSPSATPSALLDHLDAVGPAVMRRRAESAGGSRSQQWKYNNRVETEDRSMAHTRTASESAVHSARGLGMVGRLGGGGVGIGNDMGVLAEDPQETGEKQHVPSVINRSNSTLQMRALRDQMKDLRGKITSLQEQTKSGSARRRQSISSMRSTPGPYATPQSSPLGPTLKEIRESRVLDIASPIEQEWEHVTAQRTSTDSVSVYSDRSGTPTAPRREDINPPSSARPDSGSNAFSYDSYLFSESFVKGIRSTSMSSDGTASTATATLPVPHTVQRKGSIVSMSSYATADETPDVSPSRSPHPDITPPKVHHKVESTLLLPGLRPPADLGLPSPRQWSVNGSLRVDDGYHSAPHTPRVDKNLLPAPAARRHVVPTTSWYRDSVDTVRARSMLFEEIPDTDGVGGGGVAISSSARDSHMMMVGSVEGEGEIELRIEKGDRQLIEGVIEALGRVCCSLETEGEVSRAELRERLRGAMKVLEGEDLEGEIF